MQRSEPDKEKVPDGQVTQSATSSCKDANVAVSFRYLPASQEVQVLNAVAANAVLYVPAPQIKQSASSSCFETDVAASVRYVPAGQEVQVLE